MVAEFVGRGQSGSPVNGEIPHLNSNLPATHTREMLSNSTTPVDDFNSSYGMQSVKHKELFSQRKQREFTPDNKKDDSYWDRRRRNNEAAKRSREKRRFNDMVLEQRVVELTKENAILKAQLEAIKEEYGICGESVVCVEKVLANLPSSEQVLSISKRQKITHPATPLMFTTQSPIPTPVIHQPVIGSPPPQQMPHPHNVLHPPPSSHLEPAYREPDYHHPHYQLSYHAGIHYDSNNALNLSRSRSRVQSPFEVSSNSGDESTPVALTTNEPNNSLPLKLRHKSHLGDKDAANALLALQNIKQEPGPRASPPWDGEGSSDERDSGISLGAEWSAAATAAATLQTLKQSQINMQDSGDGDTTVKHRLHSEIVRLSTEVEHLKSMMNRKEK
ncbi:nuclear factor interleukin-3-regulated protein [Diorhabda sublineata]|uniref:nuclear factor interleukin-3-regulated protein n=1 Tax=Diorhabda sublineata TaxID=1163346 RepID=UPI0024E0A7B0|nr:nuclear factor interleukin-3-regulated protein [Diorhabda sublineata]XP_056646320.1 nuclear factor interleukin-3-regulated protein [Diorhabda sublineata]